MRLRIALAGAAGVLVLAGPAQALPPATDCHGAMVTDAAGDQFLVTNLNTLVRPTTAIDIRQVFLTGTAGSEKLNLRVGSLDVADTAVARQLTRYTVRWDDPVNAGYGYKLEAYYGVEDPTGTDTGWYTLYRLDPSGSWISITAATGRVFAEANGVVQWDRPASVTWPATFTGVEVRAEQYETNLVTDEGLALRADTASTLLWAQPC